MGEKGCVRRHEHRFVLNNTGGAVPQPKWFSGYRCLTAPCLRRMGGNGIICGVQDRSVNSILGVHVRAVLDKQLDDFHVALVGGASKGRSPDACAGIDIGSLLD